MLQHLRQPGAKRYLGWSLRGLAMATGLVSAIALVYLPSLSQPTLRAKVVEIAGQPDNTAVIVEGVEAKSGNEVVSGQHVTTPAKAKVSFQLTDALRERASQSAKTSPEKVPQATAPTSPSAGFRLGQQSSFVLDNECVQLESGRTVISGMQGCIGTIEIDTNNGIYTLERLGYLAEIKVLSGQVQIAIPSNPGMPPLTLKASQKITIDLTGDEIGPVRRMLSAEVQRIITGELFQGFQVPLPQQDTIASLKPKPTAVANPVAQPPVSVAPSAPSEPIQDQPEIATTTTSDHEDEIAAIRDRNIAAARRRRLPATSDYSARRSIPPYAWVSSRRQRPSSYEPPAYEPPAAEPPAAPVIESPAPTPSANVPPPVSEPPVPVTPPIEQQPIEPPVGGGELSNPSPGPIDPPAGDNVQPESPVVVPGV
ncbi:hypothetical protein [Pantanalinema sp. GBBB05]|uniref:hypothetical protein n=1 Tax=Pantanalinema sp. GBBB05 TaxID=2604139 RepID=UPI001DD42B79|nr:hypothetical protein [Pantanalinema sp. GBBB05]